MVLHDEVLFVNLAVPFGEEVPVTLQVVLGGSDGILIATDTKTMGFLTKQPPLGESERRALELGKTRSGEYGKEKVYFNESRTVAGACSGSERIIPVARAIAGSVEPSWNEFSGPVEELCLKHWMDLPVDQRRETLEEARESTVILVHCRRPEIFRIRFQLDKLEPFFYRRRRNQPLVVLGGDAQNPAGFLLERYYPRRVPSVTRLAFLAAHFILMGGDLNPGGVAGLEMFFSKNGAPFERVSDETLDELRTRSERLSKRFQRALLQSTSF